MLRKVSMILVVLLGLSLFAYAEAGDISLYTSMTSAGTTAGGLRYDFGDGWVADGTIGLVDDDIAKDAGHLAQVFADVYYGSWGVAVAFEQFTTVSSDHYEDLETNISLSFMYAVEQAVTDEITFGIAVALLTVSSTSVDDIDYAVELVNAYDIYAVLAI